MNNYNEDFTLKIKPRPSEIVSIKIPLDTLENLEIIAQNHNISVESLIKFYIGKNLREDISQELYTKFLSTKRC
ncbi:hypothetical protein [Geminocystis sp. GBBB08]|uniref:hypothetical protein n=1 Tax=Geminocystis sp. GBBB08 TaxID=2604140 RepID=UPI0027E2A643|nr:hypothetical protein [Geminocystis sp. GBBB08]MBL1209793.1 hypothetical protein [Geminocystis sp. GBBB08]